jgi:hypothetical protein
MQNPGDTRRGDDDPRLGHCEERSDEAIQSRTRGSAVLRGACYPAALCADRVARNDGRRVRISDITVSGVRISIQHDYAP